MKLYVKISFLSPSFWFSITILSYTLILPILQLQTQQLMMSQISSHPKYLIQTYFILVLILYSKLIENIASLTVLIRFNVNSWKWLTFWGSPCIYRIYTSPAYPGTRYNVIALLFYFLLSLRSSGRPRQACQLTPWNLELKSKIAYGAYVGQVSE